MSPLHPARRLLRLAAVAKSIVTPIGALAWGRAVTAESDRLSAKMHKLAEAALVNPTTFNINRARTYVAQVEPAIDQITTAQTMLHSMFFADPPSNTLN